MTYKCAKCKKVVLTGASAREYLVPFGVRTVCSGCFNPEVNKKFNDFQREKSEELKKVQIENEET
jgi:hypothetical protein